MSLSARAVPYREPLVRDEAGARSQTPTRHSNEWFGMVLFLVSEGIIFGSLFAQYFYARANQAAWPPEGVERVPAAPLALILTVVLALSGVTAHWAQTAIRRDDQDSLRAWLSITIMLGVVFLAGQAFEYGSLLAGQGLFGEPNHPPFGLNSGIYGSVFYTLTGLHGLHVTAGVVLLAVVLGRAIRGHFTPRNHFAVEGSIMYWHFVDVVWFALYLSLYLL